MIDGRVWSAGTVPSAIDSELNLNKLVDGIIMDLDRVRLMGF